MDATVSKKISKNIISHLDNYVGAGGEGALEHLIATFIYVTCPEKTKGMESLWNISGDGELVSYVPEKKRLTR